MGHSQKVKTQRWIGNQGPEANEQSVGSKIDLEVGYWQERMVERSNKKKIHQKAQYKNARWRVDSKGILSLAIVQSFFQLNPIQLLLDTGKWKKNQGMGK